MEEPTNEEPKNETPQEEEELAPYKIEAARSSRSRCRTCKRKIDKDTLRLGVLLEGPYGTGYLWHHLTCAAKRRFDDVEAAYDQETWEVTPALPPLDELRKLREKAEEKRKNKKEAPYAELAPTGRSKCRHCEKLIDKGAWRVAVLREVEFYGQVRHSPVNVHAHCVAPELRSPDCASEADGFLEALKANSSTLSAEEHEQVLAQIGPIEEE